MKLFLTGDGKLIISGKPKKQKKQPKVKKEVSQISNNNRV